MSKLFSSIPSIPLTAECTFSHPPALPEVVHLNDPALSIMTDFKLCRAITISPAAALAEAAMEMKACNVHMLLVTDKEHKVIGMITTEDLLGEKPLKVAMTRQIKRSEVSVRMVMMRQDHMTALDFNDLKHAKIGNIVETLHEQQQHYALVLETHAHSATPEIRGIFSLWEISRHVGENLTYHISEAHSLAELQRDLDG